MTGMLPILILLFVIVPIAELYVIVQVAQGIGTLETIGLLLVVSVVGGWLVKYEGLGVLVRIRRQLASAQMPTGELVDGALILFAGALMLTPGFITDGVGLLLLLPPSRMVVRRFLIRRFRPRIIGRAAGWGDPRSGRQVVVDVDSVDDQPPPRERGEIDP
jgi:UPF0716 protein FxsA